MINYDELHWTLCSKCHRVIALSDSKDFKIRFVTGWPYDREHSVSQAGYRSHMDSCVKKYGGDYFKVDREPITVIHRRGWRKKL